MQILIILIFFSCYPEILFAYIGPGMAGGIIGSKCLINGGGNVNINNCYSLGNIGEGGGGICGNQTGLKSNGRITIRSGAIRSRIKRCKMGFKGKYTGVFAS